jgi:hypothetical protein
MSGYPNPTRYVVPDLLGAGVFGVGAGAGVGVGVGVGEAVGVGATGAPGMGL